MSDTVPNASAEPNPFSQFGPGPAVSYFTIPILSFSTPPPSVSSSASVSASNAVQITSKPSASSTSVLAPKSTMILGPPHTDSGLTSAAKIGLGVGIPLAVIAYTIGLFFLYRLYRRKQLARSGRPAAELRHDIHASNEEGNVQEEEQKAASSKLESDFTGPIRAR